MSEEYEYIDMRNPLLRRESKMDKKELIMVSAFLDIGRNRWKRFGRDISKAYIESFSNYYQYLSKNVRMIVFIDDQYCEELRRSASMLSEFITLVPINKNWLNENNIYAWQQLDKMTEIMNSNYYKELVHRRIERGFPENIYPEYNAINHCKIDFVCYAATHLVGDSYNHDNDEDNKEERMFCWADFGYFYSILNNNPSEYPISPIDVSKLNSSKITFCLRNRLDPSSDQDMTYILLNAPDKFTGSFFSGNRETMLELQKLYHQSLDEMHMKGISDDDQHVYLRCFYKNPNIFQLYIDEVHPWPVALTYFEEDHSTSTSTSTSK